MADKLSEKEIIGKLRELKLGLLKQDGKRKAIKREIARLLTLRPEKEILKGEKTKSENTIKK